MNLDSRAFDAAAAVHRDLEGAAVPSVATIVSTKRRRRIRQSIAGAGLIALVAAAIAAPLALMNGNESGSDVRARSAGDTPPTTNESGAFVPPTTTEASEVVMPITLLDGRRLELRYPADVDIAGLGYVPVGLGVLPDSAGCCTSTLSVSHSTVQEVYGSAQPLQTYTGANGDPVLYFRGSDRPTDTPMNFLVFQFGDWLVEVLDLQASAPTGSGRPMTEAERATWARSLGGRVDASDFLIIEPTPPLELRLEETVALMGGASPGAPGVELSVRQCEAGATKDTALAVVPDPTETVASWCDAQLGLFTRITGPSEFVDRLAAGLEVSAPE